MRYARVPGKIRFLALLTLLFPAMAAAQVALAMRLPYWKLEWRFFESVVPAAAVGSLLLLWFLVRGNRFTKTYYVIFACTWFVLSLFRALQGDNAFYGVSLLVLSSWLFFYGWLLFRAYESPYIDSGQRWYEGTPPSLPQLSAEIETPEGRQGPYTVSRLGSEGVYLVGPSIPPSRKRPLWVHLQFKGNQLRAEALLIRERPMDGGLNKSSASHGIGVQFMNLDLDLQKEIADFVELLRGEGYVS